MQQEAKASTDEKRPATCRHHRPALRLYHTRPARYGQRGQYGQHTKENNRPARVVLCTPRVSVSTTEQPKASTPPEYGQRGHRRPPLCVRICPVVCPYLQRTPKPPPAPNRGIYRQTPRRGGAAFTPARYERHRQRGQSLNRRKGNRPRHGQPPAALRLYTTHKNGRPLRIENGRKRSLPNMDNHQRRPANICRYIYMLQRYEKPRTKQNHNAAKRNAPQRGCSVHTARPNMDNVDNMDKRPPR